jgi:hypothetical protein
MKSLGQNERPAFEAVPCFIPDLARLTQKCGGSDWEEMKAV